MNSLFLSCCLQLFSVMSFMFVCAMAATYSVVEYGSRPYSVFGFTRSSWRAGVPPVVFNRWLLDVFN